MQQTPTWVLRSIRILVIAAWFSLALGILGSATTADTAIPLVGTAAALSGIFVVALTFVPRHYLTRGGVNLEILVVSGALLTIASLTLTGRADSAYLLMALLPTLLAAIIRGHRMGLTTAFLSAGLLTAVIIATDGLPGFVASAGTVALFPLMGLVVAQIRNILVEIEARATSLEEASAQAEVELARLGQANDLLRRLTDVYGDGSTNPIEVGRAALEAIVDAKPGSFATATLFDNQGPVVVARAGSDAPNLIRAQIPLGDGETTSGVVSIGTPEPLTGTERRDIDRLLRPVAVSFANTVLLQDIAAAAVKEERLRLARELHDEVGPALAALGLSLDAAQMQTLDQALTESIGYVREGLGSVIDDLRGIIADLRAEEAGSLTNQLNSTVSRLEPPPEVRLEIREQRAPRGNAMRQILAVVTESVRNAYRHADAKLIQIVGTVDRNRVEIEIKDDGRGFDPDHLPDGHYGIMGMRERADRIGATVDIASDGGGTTVRLLWKEQR